MFRVALSLSILLAAVFPLGQYLVMSFTTSRALKASLGALGAAALVLFVKYILVAIVLYALFRMVRIDRRFDLNGRGSRQLLLANIVVLTYAVLLALARMVEGGGFGYLIGQFAFLVLWPSWAIIVWGLVLLWGSRAHMATPNTSLERTREG
jgi:hypothetical protein